MYQTATSTTEKQKHIRKSKKEIYKMKNINIILSSLTALLGLLVGIAPYTFAKVCGMASMHCHKVTAPTVLVFGIVIFVVSAAQTVILWKKR